MYKYTIRWTRGDESGEAVQRAENAQRARILFLAEHPDIEDVEVITKPRSKQPDVNFYEVGVSIIGSHLTMGPGDKSAADLAGADGGVKEAESKKGGWLW